MFRKAHYKRDVYRCTQCNGWIGPGDLYCRHCGHAFSESDVAAMKEAVGIRQTWNAPTFCRLDESYRCLDCRGFVAIDHRFCKHCGQEISEGERIVMAGDHDPGYISARYVAIPFFLIVLLLFTWIFGGI